MSQGYLISFEGLDGAGKTTQMDMLGRWLEEQEIAYIRTREPGGTPLGSEIRRLLFHHPELTITPLAETFLFQADRAQHFATLVFPALAAGTLVITDRCFDSSIAYQGAAQGVGTELVEHLSLLATQNCVPDLTFFLDLDPDQVSLRTSVENDQSGQREQQSRFDRAGEQFQIRLRQAFLALAHANPERIKIINAAQTPLQVHQDILALLVQLLRKRLL